MTCFHPLDAFQMLGQRTPNGKRVIVFSRPRNAQFPFIPIKLPCGQCIGCRLAKSREWATRAYLESTCHKLNSFLTLTYSPEYEYRLKTTCLDKSTGEVYEGLSLVKKDFQDFMKRLRRYGDYHGLFDSVSYLMCGEYGEKFGRPHFHCILFGFDFSFDRYLFKPKGSKLSFPTFRSPTLEKLWPYGNSLIGDVSWETCAYVARYVTKKVNGDMKEDHYQGRLPEYNAASLNPAIGLTWFNKYNTDVYPDDHVIIPKQNFKATKVGSLFRQTGAGVRNIEINPPKYFDRKLEELDPVLYNYIKEKRKNAVIPLEYDRLSDLEELQTLKNDKLKRPFEEMS